MSDPKDVKAHTDQIEAMFGRAALLAADSKSLRERAKEDVAKAEAFEAQALKLRANARSLVAKGPCGCGEAKKRAALEQIDAEADALESGDPAILPPVQTVDSMATPVKEAPVNG